MQDIYNQAARLQRGASAERAQRINSIVSRYDRNVTKALDKNNTSEYLAREANRQAQLSLSGRSDLNARQIRQMQKMSRDIRQNTFTTQVSRRTYMGLSNG